MSENNEIKTSDELDTTTANDKRNGLVKFMHGALSFLVGLAAFGTIKFILAILVIIFIAILGNPELTELIIKGQGIFWLLAIYLAVRYTKNLNKNGTTRTRIIKRVITIAIGFVAIFATPILMNLSSVQNLLQAQQDMNISSVKNDETLIEIEADPVICEEASLGLNQWKKKHEENSSCTNQFMLVMKSKDYIRRCTGLKSDVDQVNDVLIETRKSYKEACNSDFKQ